MSAFTFAPGPRAPGSHVRDAQSGMRSLRSGYRRRGSPIDFRECPWTVRRTVCVSSAAHHRWIKESRCQSSQIWDPPRRRRCLGSGVRASTRSGKGLRARAAMDLRSLRIAMRVPVHQSPTGGWKVSAGAGMPAGTSEPQAIRPGDDCPGRQLRLLFSSALDRLIILISRQPPSAPSPARQSDPHRVHNLPMHGGMLLTPLRSETTAPR